MAKPRRGRTRGHAASAAPPGRHQQRPQTCTKAAPTACATATRDLCRARGVVAVTARKAGHGAGIGGGGSLAAVRLQWDVVAAIYAAALESASWVAAIKRRA